MIFIPWLLNTLALLIIASILPGFHIESFFSALIVALVLGLLNVLVKPILVLLTLPATIFTLGLFLLVINALLLILTSNIVKGFTIDSFGTALLAAVLMWLISLATGALFAPKAVTPVQ